MNEKIRPAAPQVNDGSGFTDKAWQGAAMGRALRTVSSFPELLVQFVYHRMGATFTVYL